MTSSYRQAINVSIKIMDAFVAMRKIISTNMGIVQIRFVECHKKI